MAPSPSVPKGEWLSCRAASPAWELFGLPGLPSGDYPEPFDTSRVGPRLGYVHRGGAHGQSALDWAWALDFAERAFGKCGFLSDQVSASIGER